MRRHAGVIANRRREKRRRSITSWADGSRLRAPNMSADRQARDGHGFLRGGCGYHGASWYDTLSPTLKETVETSGRLEETERKMLVEGTATG